MPLTPRQYEIACLLAEAWTAAGAGARVVYQTEWLGWLPSGQYQWVDVEHAAGKDEVSLRFPSGWEMEDVLAVERDGRLRRLSETREAADEMQRIEFEMMENG